MGASVLVLKVWTYGIASVVVDKTILLYILL